MPLDPTRFESVASSSTVKDDRPCNNCGYNLQGLQTGTHCPECGTTIPVRRYAAKGDNLTDAPAGFLRRYAFVAACAAVSGVLTLLLAIGGWVTGSAALAGLGLMTSCGFAGATFMLTRPRPRGPNTTLDPTIDDRRWQLAAIAGPAAWALFAVFAGLDVVSRSNNWQLAGALDVLAWLGFLGAMIAMVPFCVHMGSVSVWAGDTGLASRLRGCAWVFGIGSAAIFFSAALTWILSSGLAAAVRIAAIGLYAAVGLAIVICAIGLAQFALVAVAAVQTNSAQHARDQRVAQRRAAQMADTVDRQYSAPTVPDAAEPLAPADSDDTPRPRIGQGQRIEPSTATEAYELEPEDRA